MQNVWQMSRDDGNQLITIGHCDYDDLKYSIISCNQQGTITHVSNGLPGQTCELQVTVNEDDPTHDPSPIHVLFLVCLP